MILNKPTLAMRELVVVSEGNDVFRQEFTDGVNVFAGENGSGKTTIADLIVFALGGEPHTWREEAKRCDFVLAEFDINGSVLSIRRNIEGGRRRTPLHMFWGPLSAARTADVAQWQVYPYAAAGGKTSASEVLFEAMGIPEVHSDGGSRITMYQMLRLLYVDQASPHTDLFVLDRFDSGQVRTAIGDLLCGVYDHAIHEMRQRQRDLETIQTAARSQLRTLRAFLGGDGRNASPEEIEKETAALSARREVLYATIRSSADGAPPLDAPVAKRSAELARVEAQLREARKELSGAMQRARQLALSTADSEMFLAALAARIVALDDAAHSHELLGAVEFAYCPSCFAELKPTSSGNCTLCGEAMVGEVAKDNRLRMRRELTQQVEESSELMRGMRAEDAVLSDRLRGLRTFEQGLALRYDEMQTSVKPATDFQDAELFRELGAIDEQLRERGERLKMAARLAGLERGLSGAAEEFAKLALEIERREAIQIDRKDEVDRAVSQMTVELLHADLPREAEFEEAREVTFSFSDNLVRVDGRNNFAASSVVYLKNVFHLALLLASLEVPYMRLPRLMIFDNVEDKGMEPARSHNFQQLVAAYSAAATVRHQIILFTSMPSPDLPGSSLLKRTPFTRAHKSLAFGA